MGPLNEGKRRRMRKQNLWWDTVIIERNKGKSCEESIETAYKVSGIER